MITLKQADALELKVFELFQQGRHKEALPLAKQVLSIREKELGPDDPATLNSVFNLAAQYRGLGDFPTAEGYYQRALVGREKYFGPEHPRTEMSLTGLAQLYEMMEEYERAAPLQERVLAVKEKKLGRTHPETLLVLNNLGMDYLMMGEYIKAEARCQEALVGNERAVGTEHPDVATTLINLASISDERGDTAKAEKLYLRALTIREKVLGPAHPDTAVALNNLGTFYGRMEDFARAEPLLLRSLAIAENALGADATGYATKLGNVAKFYERMGDYRKAEPLLLKALAIREKKLGPVHPRIASSLDMMGSLYAAMRQHAQAQPYYLRALAMNEQIFGPDHTATAMTVNNLAEHYHEIRDFAKAVPLQERAVALTEKIYGPKNSTTADALTNLASIYVSQGQYDRAEPLMQRALDIKETVNILGNAVWLYVLSGKQERAHEYGGRITRLVEGRLANVLSFADEAHRLTFQRAELRFDVIAATGTPSEIAETIWRWKGVVLDSIIEDRAVLRQADAARLTQDLEAVRLLKAQLMKMTLERQPANRPTAIEEREKIVSRLEQQISAAEGIMARKVTALGGARRALELTVEQIKAAVPPRSVLIDFVRFQKRLPEDRGEERFGAVVQAPEADPQWVDLGRAEPIERAVILYQKSVRGETDENTLLKDLQDLHGLLLAPIEKVIPADTHAMIIGPEGATNFISFATLLMPDDQFVAQHYMVRYVSSGRDLLTKMKSVPGDKFALLGSPDFAAETKSPVGNPKPASARALRAAEQTEMRGTVFKSLEGFEVECRALNKWAQSNHFQTKMYLGAEASEASVAQITSPYVLHVATHGFFVPKGGFASAAGPVARADKAGASAADRFVNPMHRSGLALAGAQRTLELWARGVVPPPDNDGILTAEEAAGLNLEGTWLVALSACDTGVGEAQDGEGVLGLRRAFLQAGTQNLLITLWPIFDHDTVAIMKDFYAAARKSGNAAKSLAEVQRDWLEKLRKDPDKGLLFAVRAAGPFIMTSQGRVEQ